MRRMIGFFGLIAALCGGLWGFVIGALAQSWAVFGLAGTGIGLMVFGYEIFNFGAHRHDPTQ